MLETGNSEQPIICVRGLHKFFGPVHIIKGVDLDVWPGEAVVIMGPSGGARVLFCAALIFWRRHRRELSRLTVWQSTPRTQQGSGRSGFEKSAAKQRWFFKSSTFSLI